MLCLILLHNKQLIMKLLYKSILLLAFNPISFFGQNIDTKHLALQLQFDWQKKQAIGTAIITASVLQEGDKIYLDAGKLSIRTIESDGKNLHFNYDGGDSDNNLEIVLDRTYTPIEVFTLKIDYHTNHENQADPNAIGGSFGKGLRFFKPTSTTPQKHKQIWSSGEPDGNKYWFPCNEDIGDIHTTEISATIPKPLMLISNGILIQVADNQDNTTLYHYKSDRPFPNYLVFIVVGTYCDVIQKSNKKKIHTYGYPHEKEAIAATVEQLPNMMQFIEKKTGYHYPFEQYSQVVVQDYPFPGLVGQNTVGILSDNYIDDYGVHKDFKYLWDGVALQALANQWFGNLIMPRSWEDFWLNNAFAQYFAGLYTIYDNSKEEYLLWYYPFERSNVLGDWNADIRHPIVPKTINNLSSFTSDSYSKFRGALVLRMLQKELGEANWWKSMRYYVKNNAGKQINTKDFQTAIEKTTGQTYQWFFDQWIYKIGMPKFEVKKTYDAIKKQLILNVKQIQSQENQTEGEVEFFQGTIEVEIEDKIEKIHIKPQQENTFLFSISANPTFVHFNVEETFFCQTLFEKTSEEYFHQLQKSKDVLAKQSALDKLVELANDSSTTMELKNRVINTIVAEFKTDQYWRYRWYVLGSLQKIYSLPYDQKTIDFLTNTINKEKSWIKSTAISMLGRTQDAKHKDLYIHALNDKSDRVVNAAAIALGKCKSPDAYALLMDLEHKPSWKNQNRISALNGLQQLADERAVDYAVKCLADNNSPRWYLATAVWDYPFAAVNTLLALGKADLGFPILFDRLKKSLEDGDINDIFQNAQLLNLLRNERAKEIYPLLKDHFKNDAAVLEKTLEYEKQFLEALKR